MAFDDIPTSGPSLGNTVHGVQGTFPSDASLQDAMAQLTLHGCDRADLSLPKFDPPAGGATPDESAENPDTDVDDRQVRTLVTGMAGYLGAAVVAGATVATGGAIGLALAAAAAVGIGTGLTANAADTAFSEAEHAQREVLAQQGRLVLSVHAWDEEGQQEIMAILQAAGATRAVPVVRQEEGISSASWTG